jgi:succinoglycan biosynthesis protein ExoA
MDQPIVSIIMPVRNEREHIGDSLDAALGQELDVPFEVIVADGASTDGTRELLDERARRDPRLRVVDNRDGGTPTGLNRALEHVRGRYFVRLDGHSVAPRDYVAHLVELLEAGECEAVGGIVRGVGTSLFGEAVAAVHSSRLAIGNAKHHYASEPVYVDHVAHGAYVTELARRIGGFDERFARNQDYEFDYRFQLAGGRILLEPRASFDWRVRETPAQLARQYFQYGYWKFRALRAHPSSLNARWLVPPAFVATVLVGSALSARIPGARWLLAATVGSYVAAIGAGSLATASSVGRPRLAPLAGVAFATIHVSWGSGFLYSAADESARAVGTRVTKALRGLGARRVGR